MFSVKIAYYGCLDSGFVTVSSFPNVESALAFALELHRVSNCPHVVHVVGASGCVIVVLELAPKSK